jgi:hypothetical protein
MLLVFKGDARMSTDHRPRYVIGPDGQPLSAKDLPCVKTQRWVQSRKAQVVAAVRGGLITADEACSRYKLTTEELESWTRAVVSHGPEALFVTRMGNYRQ